MAVLWPSKSNTLVWPSPSCPTCGVCANCSTTRASSRPAYIWIGSSRWLARSSSRNATTSARCWGLRCLFGFREGGGSSGLVVAG
eukprot:scaffold12912_cov45-Isochrysis_galbana.AAC.1